MIYSSKRSDYSCQVCLTHSAAATSCKISAFCFGRGIVLLRRRQQQSQQQQPQHKQHSKHLKTKNAEEPIHRTTRTMMICHTTKYIIKTRRSMGSNEILQLRPAGLCNSKASSLRMSISTSRDILR